MTETTSFRTATANAIATALDLDPDVDVVGGRVEGPLVNRDQALVCAWALRTAEAGYISQATTSIVVRVLLPRKSRRVVADALDPTDLETIAETVWAWAKTPATSGTPAGAIATITSWMARIVETSWDQDGGTVDFTIVRTHPNPAGF